ncbi:hypothetical protein CesoFtcFv8_027669 [Champsocephalus esox]|uniref:Uncharacterized protein n=1 Tax=Champsocephalus esox TaxID=159716 RepID=A0AAN7YFI0_9TELE|nr:hypothetical protein CesoFtcFv8_027669 [Champsocephalus esox]
MERKESVDRSFSNISPSLLESTVRAVRLCCYGGRSLKPMAEADTPESNTDTAKGRNPHGCVDKAADGEIVEAGLAGNAQ